MATKKMTSKKAEKAEKAEKVEKTVKAEKKAKTAVKAAAALKKVKAAKSAKSAKPAKPAPADQAYVPAPEVAAILPDLIALRHELHQHPERGFDTAGTRMRVAKWLSDHGVTAIENETLESALFVTVEGIRPGPTIALRADMDALPMTDASGAPYASQTPGCAHTCGHDGHTTWLAGALAALQAENDFPGRVLGIFQPAEEIGTGAMAVVKAGALRKYDFREIYGMHAEPSVDAGKMGFKVGPMQAAADFFYVTIEGKGGHGARPQMAVDPIPCGAELVGALQTVVTRRIDPTQPVVISVCSFVAGSTPACNVIPATAELSGTVRTFDAETRKKVRAEMAKTVKAVAEAHGCVGSLRIEDFGNPVINHPETTAFARAAADELYGEGTGVDFPLTMGGEDFSEYQAVVPGTMIRFGVRDAKHQASLHHPKFDFNDRVLGGAATFLAETVRKRLAMLAD